MKPGAGIPEIERANGKPFTLAGFHWDYEGTVTSWEGGALDSLPPGVNRVIVRFRATAENQVTDAENGQLAGDRDLASTNPILRRVVPRVYSVGIWFVEGGLGR